MLGGKGEGVQNNCPRLCNCRRRHCFTSGILLSSVFPDIHATLLKLPIWVTVRYLKLPLHFKQAEKIFLEIPLILLDV